MGLTLDAFCFRMVSVIPRFDPSQEMHDLGAGTKPAEETRAEPVVGCRERAGAGLRGLARATATLPVAGKETSSPKTPGHAASLIPACVYVHRDAQVSVHGSAVHSAGTTARVGHATLAGWRCSRAPPGAPPRACALKTPPERARTLSGHGAAPSEAGGPWKRRRERVGGRDRAAVFTPFPASSRGPFPCPTGAGLASCTFAVGP